VSRGISPSSRRVTALRVIAFLSAAASLAALLAQVFLHMPMAFFLLFVGMPSVFLLYAIAAYAKRIDAGILVDGMAVGLRGGFFATIGYDIIRWFVQLVGPFIGYNGFVPILLFGSWITGQPTTSVAAAVAGWLYHYWNGLSFGIMYALIFGKRHWLYGVAYGVVVELCMLGVFPFFLKVSNKFDFVAISLIGHVFYGAILGVYVQRYARFR
jgi:hypothetical protein